MHSLESLQDRRHNHQLTLFYKMHTNLALEYLTYLVPQPVGAASRYNLRNANNLQTITTRTNLYYQSFLPSTIKSWNNLPIEIKQADTVNSFKNHLIKKQPVPKYYYVGNRRVVAVALRTHSTSFFIVDTTQFSAMRCLMLFQHT